MDGVIKGGESETKRLNSPVDDSTDSYHTHKRDVLFCTGW